MLLMRNINLDVLTSIVQYFASNSLGIALNLYVQEEKNLLIPLIE